MATAELLAPGLAASLQDMGRRGWRRFGVPSGGAMDRHAARLANRLVGNPEDAPVLELLLQGGTLRFLRRTRIAVTGADAGSGIPLWQSVEVQSGQVLRFPQNHAGVWTYIAVESGWRTAPALGAASALPSAGLGPILSAGALLETRDTPDHAPNVQVASPVARRRIAPSERRDYGDPPPLQLWPGPQWEEFPDGSRQRFVEERWIVSPDCSRVGYRLRGAPLQPPEGDMVSTPMRVGSIQVPPGGSPIVLMRDGPTVGGYPVIGWIDSDSLNRLAQCRPGQPVHFRIHAEARPQL